MKLFEDGFTLDTAADDYRDRVLELGKRAENATSHTWKQSTASTPEAPVLSSSISSGSTVPARLTPLFSATNVFSRQQRSKTQHLVIHKTSLMLLVSKYSN
jgi:hypothetical protein